jgi:hypothetical protein
MGAANRPSKVEVKPMDPLNQDKSLEVTDRVPQKRREREGEGGRWEKGERGRRRRQ